MIKLVLDKNNNENKYSGKSTYPAGNDWGEFGLCMGI